MNWKEQLGGFVVGSDKERCCLNLRPNLQSLDLMTLLPPPLTLLESKLNDSETWIQGLLTSSCSSFILTFGRAAIGFIISTSVSLVGEECIGSIIVKEFICFLEIQNQILFKKPPDTLSLLLTLELHSFYTHAFVHFHVFHCPGPALLSPDETLNLCVFIWCADSAAQAERDERRDNCQTDIWETGISAQSSVLFLKSCTLEDS